VSEEKTFPVQTEVKIAKR